MASAKLYALGLALLGGWGVFTASQAYKAARPWSRQRWSIFLADILLIGSCFLCAVSLAGGGFRAWLLVPLGVSFLWMIPLPCYFEAVDRIRWLHAARNLLFIAVAALCFALALGLVPLAWFGL